MEPEEETEKAEHESNAHDDMKEDEHVNHDDDTSSSDSEGDDIPELEAAVTKNPNNYDAHQQYISALRKIGALDKLREAREAMNALFPLSGEMWQEWTKDEARILSGDRSQDVTAVQTLYERGVNEYLYVPLWVDYLKFVEEHDLEVAQCSPEGLKKMRALCERAITAAGLHLAEGWQVWEAYREFEQAVLLTMANSNAEEKAKQVERVRNLFHRQLAVPLAKHASTLQEYKEWEVEQGIDIRDTNDEWAGIDLKVLSAYKKANKFCSDYKTYEDKIECGKPVNAELLQNYLEYISVEESNGDPARVQVLFERAVVLFPVTTDLWLKYTCYLDQNLKVASVCKSVYARAVRNCPWLEELWRKYMLVLERFGSADDEISAVFEQSLQKGFQTPNEYLDIFLTRIDGLRRQMISAENKQSELDRLREMFHRASEFLSIYFPDFVDRSLQLHAYWAQVEAGLFKDLEAARGAWEGLIKIRGWMTEVWQGYIGMELGLGNIKEARALYKRCYSRKLEGNGTEVICQSWLRFEREYGSLEDLDRAFVKAGQRLEEVRSMQLVQDAKSAANEEAKSKTRGAEDNGKRPGTSPPAKRKRDKDMKEGRKRQKTVPKLEPHKMDHDATDGAIGGKAEGSTKLRKKPVHRDECTAFVSNFALEVTEKDLRKFFAPCGGLKEIRMLKDRYTKRSRGLAYVDFENEENLLAAVSKNKSKLKGRRVSVRRSDPTAGRGQAHGGDGGGDGGDAGSEGGDEGGGDSKGKDGPRRMVKPLGWAPGQTKGEPPAETPKTNQEFRNMLLKRD